MPEIQSINREFLKGILLKIAFKPEAIRRAQAFLLYVALNGETFTADVLPGEICNDNTTAGCAVKSLATLGLIQFVDRRRSPAKSRHGAEVKSWRLADGKRATAQTWLTRHGFDLSYPANRQLTNFV